jgi:hypothetical protein
MLITLGGKKKSFPPQANIVDKMKWLVHTVNPIGDDERRYLPENS